MSEFKGTPGPWAGKDVHICQQDKAGLQIGFLMTYSDERRKEGAANAHLIAAAPELLEALQEMVSAIKITLRVGHERIVELGGGCDSPEVMIKGHSGIARAEAAIAKALGQ